jgi:protein O-mannosyl-transferase
MNALHKEKNLPIILAAFSIVLLLAYWPAVQAGFTNYDDPLYVTANSRVKAGLSGASVIWAFSTFHSYNWHPLTWLSHMLDVQLFGLTPVGHHLTNLLFHVGNSLLLFGALRKMTGATWRSLCVAALFALHPLHVESVAWVAERKDVLSGLFWMLVIWSYALYVKKPDVPRYLLVAMFFLLGLMAKPMLVTLPFVLLLLDYWPLRRRCPDHSGSGAGPAVADCKTWAHLILEKAPLLVLSCAASVVAYLAQARGGAIKEGSFAVNAAQVLVAYATYIKKTVWPTGLAVFYPLNTDSISVRQVAAAIFLLAAVSCLVAWGAPHRPYLAVGWLWYLGSLVPVIGIIKLGQHAVADRYTYIPLIGLFIILVWGAADLAAKWEIRKEALALAGMVVILCMAVMTWAQARYWKDSITLFGHAIEVTEDNWLAHKNLGAVLLTKGDLPGALRHVTESLRIMPDSLEYAAQAWILSQLGNYHESVAACKKALAMDPDNERAHFVLGMDYALLKDRPSAMTEYDYLTRTNSRFSSMLDEYLKDR